MGDPSAKSKAKSEATANPAQTTYRISELVEASGASRDMVKYYLRAGLLPPAQKPRQNLSLYTEAHLALIGLIRQFQDDTKLSLPEIAEVFANSAFNVEAIKLALLSATHSMGNSDTIIPLQSTSSHRLDLDLPESFLSELGAASLLPDEGAAGEDAEQIATLLWAAHSAGVPLSFFVEARTKLAELAELELQTLIRVKRPSECFEEVVENVASIDRIINRWINAEKSQRIRQQFTRVIENSEQATLTLLDSIYRPSHLFRERHRISERLHHLFNKMDTAQLTATRGRDLSFASLLFGEFDLAISLATGALQQRPGDSTATALLALAHGLQDNADEAFAYGAQLEDCDDNDAAILQARLLALLLKVAKLRGVADTVEMMKNAAELFLELPPEPSVEEPEAALLLARANVAFPDFANSRERAIRGLTALLEALEADAVALPELFDPYLQGCLETLYQTHARYYLGVLHAREGNTEQAQRCLEWVIQADPASNFGESAYRLLGQQENPVN